MIKSIIDVDDKRTWPPKIAKVIKEWSNEYKDSTQYTGDLELPLEYEDGFRKELSGSLLRAYHCTRLLPIEIEMIRTHGLRLLSRDLVRDRIDAALQSRAISEKEAAEWSASHVFATNEQEHRENQICLILSKAVFKEGIHGCLPLLCTWGGEGIYKSSKMQHMRDRLKTLGMPSVVISHVDLSSTKHLSFPSLHKLFVGKALSLEDSVADLFYRNPIPPEWIEQILQPGDRKYKSLGDMPII